MESILVIAERIRPIVRRLFGRTPPQMETEWTCLSNRAPSRADAGSNGLVEVYRTDPDSMFHAYFWSLASIHPDQTAKYYWRKSGWPEQGDRPYRYFVRSRIVFG